MADSHAIVSAIKALASDLGRAPTRDEFLSRGTITERQVRSAFGGWTPALTAAGFAPHVEAKKPKFKFTQRKIESFVVHDLDLADLFARAGNPEVLKVLAQPDTHTKYRDKKAWSVFCQFAEYFQPDIHLIMGDFVDCEDISPWPSSDVGPRDFVGEIKESRALLKEIVKLTPSCSTRLFIEGNHENWIDQAKASSSSSPLHHAARELGLEPGLKEFLELDKHGYHLFPVNDFVKMGQAYFTHGVYTGDNHAKKHLTELKVNIYYGHTHDGQGYQAIGLNGTTEAHSLFCLCRLDAKFLRGKPNRWGHGFGEFHIFRDGTYNRAIHRIHEGVLAYNGKVFRAKE